MEQISQHRFIFIGGLHRSGTSVLHRCIRSHPQASGFSNTGVPEDEGQLLQNVYPPARVYGGPGLFAFSPEAHLTEDSQLATPENAQRLFDEWKKYWDLSKPNLLEKSPPNVIRTRFLQALFPNSCFIFILRHPAAVSLATAKWLESPIARLLEHWNAAHHQMLNDLPHLKRAHVLRYEDFITNPQAVLARIWEFLELSPPAISERIETSHNSNYLQQWQALLAQRPKLAARIPELEELPAHFGYRLTEPFVIDETAY